MTVLGVAGCTALLLIGFGIQDSLLPIVTKQSTELTHNDMSITLSDPKALTMEQGLAEELDSNSAVQNWGAVYTKSTTIYNAEGESASVSIVAAAKDSDLTRYVTFRTRKGHKAISFDSGSAILTEKTAENLGLHTGDTFWVENTEGARVELTLTGITENYMFTRLYLPAHSWKACWARRISRGTRSMARPPAPMLPGTTPCAPTCWTATTSAASALPRTPPSCSITSSSVWAMWWC